MTYILKRLPNIDELKKELETQPTNIKYYIKYDTFIGDDNSIEYLNNKIKSYEKDSANLR
jgi:hypothetical protein